MYSGWFVYCDKKATLSIGNVLPLRPVPEGAVVCNVEHRMGDQGAFAQASGTAEPPGSSCRQADVAGDGGQLVLKWRNGDGRFWEQFDGVEMTIEWGCSGAMVQPWAVDAAERCSVLELDDQEVSTGLGYILVPEFSNLAPSNFTGVKQEGISYASINSGFLTTLLEDGDVKGAFVGHDHVNDFCGDVYDIKLFYAGGFGYHAYGKAGWDRRTRVVAATLAKDEQGDLQGVRSVVTWKRLDNEKFGTIDFESVWSNVNNP